MRNSENCAKIFGEFYKRTVIHVMIDDRTAYADGDEPIKAFIDACNVMCEAKYLLSERKISNLMKTIATYPRLYTVFKDALAGYNSKAEFRKSQVRVGVRGKFVPPQNQTKFLAYVFCILLDIDGGRVKLREFLDEYFYNTNPNEEFAFFCSALIVPFRDVTEYVYYNGADSYLEDDGAVDGTLRDSVKQLLQEMNTAVSESTVITMATKQDLFLIARAIESAMTPNRIDLIKPLLTGYKNTVNACLIREKLTPYLDKLYKLFIVSEIF